MSIGWCIPMRMLITTTMFLQLVGDPNSPFMNHLIAHQTTFFHMETPILKRAFRLAVMVFSKCWSYLFIFSKGPSRTHVFLL
jgi:hypothetical protein